MKNGISTNVTLMVRNGADLRAAGCEFVFRYYCTEATHIPEKILRPQEAGILQEAGLAIATVYEFRAGAGDHISDFDQGNAVRDAKVALEQSKAAGQPQGSAIYFAVDSDFTERAQVAGQILNYFNKVTEEFARAEKNFPLGVYGSGYVCRTILELCPAVKYTWLAESTGWKESATYSAWDVKQYRSMNSYAGLDQSQYERCDAQEDFGSWFTTSDNQRRNG